ncbi:MAG: hypothetical protein RIC56_05130 [Pseudomonadales bacterium]
MGLRRRTATPTHAALLAALLAGAATAFASPLELVWHDDFSPAERQKLAAWVYETGAAVERLVGEFPMGVQVVFHRRDGAREPVPWANTRRSRGQGVHFHVDPSYPLAAFRADWTAPHELSHLILPYLGRRHAWFAEGFASYLQYPVMQEMGVLTAAEAERRYRRNFERAERGYGDARAPFARAAPRLRAERKYPVMYWGGAAYFLQVDKELAMDGSSLLAVLRDYLRCCRRDRASLDVLLADLDRLAGAPLFSDGYARFASEPGFPEFRDYRPRTDAG